MNRSLWHLAAVALVALTVPLAGQQEVPFRGDTPIAPQGLKVPPLPDPPVRYETAEGQNIRVSVYARGLRSPWSMVWVSDDTILVSERGGGGAIRVVRNGVVDPQPVAGAPMIRGQGGIDLALHPDFDRNHYVYISYSKPIDAPAGRGTQPGAAAQPVAAAAGQAGRGGAQPDAAAGGRGGRGGAGAATLAVARAVWDGKALTGLTDIFVGQGGGGGPITFGGDGMLYVSSGGGGGGGGGQPATQNPNTIGGKILRLTDTGAVPPDNPFVGRTDARPEVFTMGHRNTLRLAKHPGTGAIWQLEMGPNGGDEINILVPGANYGWPLVSLGRTYAGPWQGPFSKEGFRDAVVLWVPSIASSSLTFYTGDKLPKWKGDVFVSGMRYGEIPGTGRLDRILINKNLEELRRETLLGDLRRRIRDVKQGRDGLLYLLTDEADAVMLRIEPAE
jgi:glucose/arabinose dehydrogenase